MNNRYVGKRYVPKYSGQHDKTKQYESLEIVSKDGNTYTSIKNVPVNTELTNTSFWVKSSDFNAQLQQYIQDVSSLATRVGKVESTVSGTMDSVNNALNTNNAEINKQVDAKIKIVNDSISGFETRVQKVETDVLNAVTEIEIQPLKKLLEDVNTIIEQAKDGEKSLLESINKKDADNKFFTESIYRATIGEKVSNAPMPLYIHEPSYKDQHTHPHVIYVEQGFLGHKYLMVNTPYEFANDQLENPCLYLSNDGVSWKYWENNPIQGNYNDSNKHNSDPFLIYNETANNLEVWYRYTQKSPKQDTFYRKIITNSGVIGNAEQMCQFNANVMSPSIVVENGKYIMYTVENGKLYRRSANASTPNNFGVAELCSIPTIRNNFEFWHCEVRKMRGKYYLIYNDLQTGNKAIGGACYVCESNDGYNFTLNMKKVVEPSNNFRWDGACIYKSSLLDINGIWHLYYSAISNKNCWGIGLITSLDLNTWYLPKWSMRIKTNTLSPDFTTPVNYRNYFRFTSSGEIEFSLNGRAKNDVDVPTASTGFTLAFVPWYLVPQCFESFPLYGQGKTGSSSDYKGHGLAVLREQEDGDASVNNKLTVIKGYTSSSLFIVNVRGRYNMDVSWNE